MSPPTPPAPAALPPGDPRLPLHARLRDALAARLAAGEWPHGAALPAEAQLAHGYGVALQTMRRALGQLAAEGLVERRHGRGTFSRLAPAASSMLRFFRLADPAAGGAILPESRILEAAAAPLPAAFARRLGRAPGSPALRLHRLRSWQGEVLLAETIHLPLPEAAPLLDLAPDAYGALLYPLLAERCGLVVARVEDEISVARADARTALALGVAAGEAVIAAERTAFDATGRAVEARLAFGRADRFRYRASAA